MAASSKNGQIFQETCKPADMRHGDYCIKTRLFIYFHVFFLSFHNNIKDALTSTSPYLSSVLSTARQTESSHAQEVPAACDDQAHLLGIFFPGNLQLGGRQSPAFALPTGSKVVSKYYLTTKQHMPTMSAEHASPQALRLF